MGFACGSGFGYDEIMKKEAFPMSLKTHLDAIREYGHKIGPAEVNTNTAPVEYYVEDEKGRRTPITNNEALQFIANAKMDDPAGGINTYDNYTKLFTILGIRPKW